jgi:phospholipid/cholesterol/gamma-HCH transport system permease protein
MFLLRWIENLGDFGERSLNQLGRFGLFLGKTVVTIFTPPFKFGLVVKRIFQIGSSSMGLIFLIAAFTGAVLGLQIHYQLVKFGAAARTGTVVSLSLIRELGPVVCALMVAGRAGTALASELGVMRISEQFDAMKIMNLNPFRYLMAPIFLASIISVFLLTAFFNVVGITGGFVVSSGLLGLSQGSYYSGIIEFVAVADIINGAIKSLVFGGIIAWVSCYKGYYTGHGAEGVGRAATESMVLSSILILVFDYIMTSIMFTG